jgi:hypothetical protein
MSLDLNNIVSTTLASMDRRRVRQVIWCLEKIDAADGDIPGSYTHPTKANRRIVPCGEAKILVVFHKHDGVTKIFEIHSF